MAPHDPARTAIRGTRSGGFALRAAIRGASPERPHSTLLRSSARFLRFLIADIRYRIAKCSHPFALSLRVRHAHAPCFTDHLRCRHWKVAATSPFFVRDTRTIFGGDAPWGTDSFLAQMGYSLHAVRVGRKVNCHRNLGPLQNARSTPWNAGCMPLFPEDWPYVEVLALFAH